MELFDAPLSMQRWSDEQRQIGRRIAVVPTMGALHDGHLALVDEARRHADVVVVTIFVNPLQFNVTADFEKYPRPIDDDLAACERAGVDAVYAPTAAAMYPAGFQTHIEPGPLADVLEGAFRPGHFRGVTTVVGKLFAAVRPHAAIFGEKDFQQLAVIHRMVTDLDLGIDVIGLATVRDADGVAMSSRNRRLTPDQRAAAVCVPASLRAVADALRGGELRADSLEAIASRVVAGQPSARLEYVTIVDAASLQHVDVVEGEAVALTAVWFGDVRLIDNLRISGPASSR